MKKLNKKGFTLVEMLVVIAIIAVLVAIVVPTVSTSTEKAREAADAANLRTAVTECTTAALSGSADGFADVKIDTTGTTTKGNASKDVELTQTQAGWKSGITDIGGVAVSEAGLKDADKDVTLTVTVTPSGVVSFAKKGGTT